MRITLVVAIAVLAAGCASPSDSPSFQLMGSFTADRTQGDLDEFHGLVAPYSDDVAIMESFPEQFAIRGIVGGCEQLRATLTSKDYIATLGSCTIESDPGDGGDEPVSSP